jgi:AcrR family transcriptional regulator
VVERDAERSKNALLDAAEDIFARCGFDAATMKSIGDAAGLSRGAAGYFFGSKKELYEAVLARVIERARVSMLRAYEHTEPTAGVDDAVAAYVEVLLEFLATDFAFLRLVQREALADASRLAELFGQPVEDALTAFASAADFAGVSPQRLLLDVIALCWYPFAHEHTMLPALGMHPRDAAFLQEHKQHVVRLVTGRLARPDEDAATRGPGR